MDHQALLRRADRDVDAERVHRERRRGERGDDVDDEERRMARRRRSRARIAARSQVVPLAVSVWTTKTAPIACARSSRSAASTAAGSIGKPSRYGVRTRDAAERLDLLGPAVGEVAGARHQHRRARRDQVGDHRLPAAVAVGGVEEDVGALGLRAAPSCPTRRRRQERQARVGEVGRLARHRVDDLVGNAGRARANAAGACRECGRRLHARRACVAARREE